MSLTISEAATFCKLQILPGQAVNVHVSRANVPRAVPNHVRGDAARLWQWTEIMSPGGDWLEAFREKLGSDYEASPNYEPMFDQTTHVLCKPLRNPTDKEVLKWADICRKDQVFLITGAYDQVMPPHRPCPVFLHENFDVLVITGAVMTKTREKHVEALLARYEKYLPPLFEIGVWEFQGRPHVQVRRINYGRMEHSLHLTTAS